MTARAPRGPNFDLMARGRPRNSRPDADADIVLAYGVLPEEAGGDGSTLTLVDVAAAHRTLRAARCSTWGEYVHLAGLTWERAIRDFREWLADLNGGSIPEPGTEFHFERIAGATLLLGEAAYWIARWVPDPRDVAVDVLEGLGKRATPALTIPGLEEVSGSPDGHLRAICASDAAVFRRLLEALHLAGFSNVTISRDDVLVRQCIVL